MTCSQHEPSTPKNFYAALGVKPTAGLSEIRSAYRVAALQAHPDKGGSKEAFHALTFAFEVLSCSASREVYDRHNQSLDNKLRQFRTCSKTSQFSTTHNRSSQLHRRTRDVNRNKQAGGAKRRRPRDIHQTMWYDSKRTKAAIDSRLVRNPLPSHLESALEQLRLALKAMGKNRGHAAIENMDPRMKTALVSFIEGPRRPTLPLVQERLSRVRAASMFRESDVRSVRTLQGDRHQAHLRLRNLRMYTREQDTIEEALKHQIVLVQVRHAIEVVGDAAWNDPALFYEIFCGVLAQHGTCEQHLGFAVFIYMRADEWIDRTRVITSPVLPLLEAVRKHGRLLESRKLSWEHLKAEWLPMLQRTQLARANRLSLFDVDALAEKAHQGRVERRFNMACVRVQRALKLSDYTASRAAKEQLKLHRRATKIRSVAATRRLSEARTAEKEKQAERRRWFRNVHLTTQEIIHGPPPHLRAVRK